MLWIFKNSGLNFTEFYDYRFWINKDHPNEVISIEQDVIIHNQEYGENSTCVDKSGSDTVDEGDSGSDDNDCSCSFS